MIIRSLDADLESCLRVREKASGRTIGAEAEEILRKALSEPIIRVNSLDPGQSIHARFVASRWLRYAAAKIFRDKSSHAVRVAKGRTSFAIQHIDPTRHSPSLPALRSSQPPSRSTSQPTELGIVVTPGHAARQRTSRPLFWGTASRGKRTTV